MRFIFLIVALVFATLACNAVTQPINQAQEIVSTVESIATALPVETIMAIPSILPSEMPSLELTPVPGLDATSLPSDIDCFTPKSDPLEAWQDIPVMPQAKAGDECTDLYVYTVAGKPEDVKAFYDEALAALGWQAFSGLGETGAGGLFLIYQKDNETVSIIVAPSLQGDDLLTVMLTKG
jgi:hypothetical protein